MNNNSDQMMLLFLLYASLFFGEEVHKKIYFDIVRTLSLSYLNSNSFLLLNTYFISIIIVL